MRHLALVLVAALAGHVGSALAAHHATPWKPGSAYLVGEDDVNGLMEKTYDHAYCSGIPRFGHRGSFPYEEYTVFDCQTSRNGRVCTDVRVQTIKATQPRYFRVKFLRIGECY